MAKKVGLALGGGAARGLAHIGVIIELQKHAIPIHMVAGTSAGSVAGGLFAAGLTTKEMMAELNHLSWKNFAGFHLSKQGMFSSKPIEKLIEKLVGHVKLKDLKLPFTALATDVISGEGRVLDDPEYLLSHVVRASASFPGVFPPMKIGKRYYFDGGTSGNLPSEVVRDMGADVVIAVDVIPPQVHLKKMPRHMLTCIDRGLDLMLHNVSIRKYRFADVVLKPVNISISSFAFNKVELLVELGRISVMDNLDKIKEAVYG